MSGEFSGDHNWGQECYWKASSGQKPRMLLISYNAQHPTARKYPEENVNSPEVEKSYFKAVLSRKQNLVTAVFVLSSSIY